MALQQDFRVKRGLVVSEAANVVGNAAIGNVLTAVGNTTLTNGTVAITTNTTVSSVAVTANSQTFKSNSSVTAVAITANATATNTAIGGTNLAVSANTTGSGTLAWTSTSIDLNANTTFTIIDILANNTVANLSANASNIAVTSPNIGLKPNSSVTAVGVISNGTSTNTTIGGTNFAINANTTLAATNTTATSNLYWTGDNVQFKANATITALAIASNTTAVNTVVYGTNVTINATTVGITGSTTFSNNVVISGNLIVSGTTTYVNTATLNIADNIVTLNADVGAIAPTENAGIEINRGTSANAVLTWDETNDRWTATGNVGLSGAVAEIHIGGTGAANLAVDNAGGTVIQDLAVNVDSFGHLRTITSTSANLDARYLTFSNIVAGNSSQANVVADLYNDTLTLANSTGIDITTNASTDTITFTHSDTSSQANVSITNTNGSVLQGITLNVDGFGHVVNAVTSSVDLDNRYTRTAFANIAVSGQSTIVADTIADTLTLVGAGSVSITTDASTDTITITGAATTGTLTTVANTSVNQGLVRLSAGGANSDATVVGGGSVVVSSNSTAVLVNGLILDSVANTSTVYAATANSVKTAYDRAGTAYSNATSYADTIAGTAYSNATSYADTIAGTAYSNATSYADTIAGTAYSNATSFAANANNLSSGTVAVARGGTGTGNFATAGLAYVNGTTAFTTATAAQVVSAIGTTKVANATYADSAGSATTAGAVTNGVYTSGDQTIGGNKTFSATLGVAGQTAFGTGNWTTGGWKRGISMSTPYTIWWAKGSSDVSKGIGATDDNLIRFIASTADSGTTETYPFQFDMSAGDLTAIGNVTAYSDIKLKTDLARITNALDKVQQLTGYTYTRIDSGQRQTGLIAQDVQKVLPEAVIESPGTDTLALAYGNLVGLLVEAIKELKQEVDDLRSKLQ